MENNKPENKELPLSEQEQETAPVKKQSKKKGNSADKAKKEENRVTVEEKAKERGKVKLSKRSIVIIACLCAVVIALSIALPIGIIFAKRTTTPKPEFYNFDENSSYSIYVKWDKIRGAGLYDCQYCYGDPDSLDSAITTAQTENARFVFPRHKGIVAFRVKALIDGEKTEYSDWIRLDVPAWKLEKPIVTITDSLAMSWAPSTYKLYDKTLTITGYEYKMLIDGEEVQNASGFSSTTSLQDNRLRFIQSYKSDVVNEYELNGNWEDFEFELQVRAVTYTMWANKKNTPTSEDEIMLEGMYDYSDYGSAKIIVTEEIYNQLK